MSLCDFWSSLVRAHTSLVFRSTAEREYTCRSSHWRVHACARKSSVVRSSVVRSSFVKAHTCRSSDWHVCTRVLGLTEKWDINKILGLKWNLVYSRGPLKSVLSLVIKTTVLSLTALHVCVCVCVLLHSYSCEDKFLQNMVLQGCVRQVNVKAANDVDPKY